MGQGTLIRKTRRRRGKPSRIRKRIGRNWTQCGNGWDSEVAADRVTSQLNKLKKSLASDKPLEPSLFAHLVSEDVSVHSILPENLTTAFQTEQLTVQRAARTELESGKTLGLGAEALANELEKLIEPFVNRPALRLKLKVFRVEQSDNVVTTRQTLEAYGETAKGTREINAVWQCEWTGRAKPILKSIQATQFESIDLTSDLPLFSDCTESVFGGNRSFREQLSKGYQHWLNRQQLHSSFVMLANNGVAVGDVNADGLEDVFLCQESEMPNLLFLQQPDGSLKDVSDGSGVDWLQNSATALILDFNNDGHQDLAVSVSNTVVMAMGDSSGKFKVKSVIDCEDEIWSLSAIDYDRDGLLDLYVGAYSQMGVGSAAANIVLTENLDDFSDGGINTLLRNDSTEEEPFRFVNVTEEVGLMVNNHRRTYSAGWEDYDNDGDPDLYVANDFGWNNFYRHDIAADGSIRFVDIAEQANARDDSFGMSVNWGDYDRDGWMDVYISNMYSYAGNRITFQDQFKAGDNQDIKQRFQRYARGNTLLRNTGKANGEGDEQVIAFEDRTMETAVNMGRWAWCSCFIDMNNDGWEDLYVNNGYITASESGDL